MAADVSSLIRVINGVDGKESVSSGNSTAPITRDLLGGCRPLDTKELDLDLQVPCGWEKRLDLKSGKVYLQRCSSSTTSENKPQSSNSKFSKFQDLNFPPSSKKTLNLFDDSSLDLKMVPSSSSDSPTTSSNYQSVCTLDKVKSALERAEKETFRKRTISMSKSSSSPLSNSSSSVRDSDHYDPMERSSAASFAAGCPSCLMYVLISKSNPMCPRCNSVVPLPVDSKKPRIDLNMSI